MLFLAFVWSIAESVAGRFQPNRLDFGQVRVGATVEGSILVFTDVEAGTELSCDVQPPPFVRVTGVRQGTATGRNDRTKITVYVYLTVSTEQLGEHTGTMAIEAGPEKYTIPVRVSVSPPQASDTPVLIVTTPFTCSSTDDAALFDPWLHLVASAQLDPDYLDIAKGQPVLRDLELSGYKVILLGEYGLLRLQDSDVAKLKQFVHAGGRLVICANYFFRGTVNTANRLLVSAGLRMRDTEPAALGDSFPLSRSGIVQDPLTQGVHAVQWFRPSPIAVIDGAKGRVLVSAPPYSGEGFLAAGRHGKGQIIALGQSLWWNWIGDARYQDSDNQQLLRNLLAQTAE